MEEDDILRIIGKLYLEAYSKNKQTNTLLSKISTELKDLQAENAQLKEQLNASKSI
jgi:cell shape-determining protein MreC